jgi:ABC-type dipeptide/oligopeptide/nickel transport system ATPase component
MNNILEVKNLNVKFDTTQGEVTAVNNISFNIKKGECIGVAGESGSGKTQTFFSITGILSDNGKATGEVIFNNLNLLDLNERELTKIRGKDIGFIFQDPMTSLTPHMKIGDQLTEVSIYHDKKSKSESTKKAKEVLDKVRLPRINNLIKKYPHELSGGMRQRIMIGISLMCNPRLIIADEPTTALDVTTQKDILKIFSDLQKEKITIALITHDIGVLAEVSDNIIIMNEGSIVEKGKTNKVLVTPEHDYTKHLLSCVPEWLK